MKSRLDQIEGTIKSLFEGSPSLFPWMDEQSSWIHKLIESIEDCYADFENEAGEIPDKFSLYLNAEDRRFLERQKDWQNALNRVISEISSELGYPLEKKPEIQVITRQSLPSGEVHVAVLTSSGVTGKTSAVPVPFDTHDEIRNLQTCKAALILEDESSFYLEKPVTNIGRKSNNHLVINDLRVSRNHAQIRAIPDGFIIFDIGSSGGTYINGERVYQHKLKPGDVISLAGIKMIYTEEQTNLNEGQRQITSEIKPLTP